MEALKDWLLAVLAVSLLTAIAQAVMPEGSVKAVGRLACGLLVFLAVARPVLGIDYARLTSVIRSYTELTQQTESELTETKNSLTESIIAQETAAYIQDTTETLGLDCTAAVDWDWSEDGLPTPTEVIVTGDLTFAERETLTDTLTQELGLERERIVYADDEEEP